ncbi:MAG: sugar transferase [Actinomycetota bacterium]
MIVDHASSQSSTARAASSDVGIDLRRNRWSLGVSSIRAGADALAILIAVLSALVLRFRFHVLESKAAPFDLRSHLVASVLWIAGVMGAMASHRLYDEDTLVERSHELIRMRRSLLEGVALVSAAVFLFEFVRVSRGWFVLLVGLTFLTLHTERTAIRAATTRLRKNGRLRRTAIVVSSSPSPSSSSHSPGAIPDNEFEVVATVAPNGLANALQTLASDKRSTPVVIVDGRMARDHLWSVVLEAGRLGAPVFLRSQFRPLPADRLATRTLGSSTIVKVSPPKLKGVRVFEKRAFDLIGSIVLLSVLMIPMAIIALAIVISSGRPVFYRQQRVGFEEKLFRIWKFRTMHVLAEQDTGPVWAAAGDPRRTKIGRFLRRSSLDELPQLFNVLRGDMSIVGPRPERPMFVARFSADHRWYGFRHRIKPGMTGLAQVRGHRGDTPLEPRIESDNDYIESWSLWLDIRTLIGTACEIVRGTNAQ